MAARIVDAIDSDARLAGVGAEHLRDLLAAAAVVTARHDDLAHDPGARASINRRRLDDAVEVLRDTALDVQSALHRHEEEIGRVQAAIISIEAGRAVDDGNEGW